MKINRHGIENATKKTYLEYLRLFPVLKKERTKQYGMLIFTFVTMTFFGIFAINPTLTTIVELQRKLEDAIFAEEQLSLKIDNLRKLQGQYQTLSTDLETIEQTLPPNANAPRFIGQLQTLIAQSGVTLGGLGFGELTLSSVPPVDEGTFTFSMEISGTFAQVDAFLKNLTSFDRIITLDGFSITKQAAGNTTMTVTIEGAAHFKK